MHKITVAYLEEVLTNMSSTENIGASDELSGLTKSVCTEIVSEEDERVDAFDFGIVHVNETKALHLDECDVPVIGYEMQFVDLGVALPIEARRSSLWYYYPGRLTAIDGHTKQTRNEEPDMKNDTHDPTAQTEQQKKNTFLKNLRSAGDATIARFLGHDLADLDTLTKRHISNALSMEYDDISEHELDAFEREMMADIEAQNKNRNDMPQSVLPFDRFTEHIRAAGVDSIIRFLNIDRDELLELAISDQLTSRIAETHAQMPDDDIAAFERDILHTIRRNRENAPIWAKICHDHHEETDGFVVGYVDAWLTDQEDEDEEGKVIAQVVGAIVDGKPSVYVAHCDPRARFDANAKAAVAACTEDILAELNKAVLSNHAELRRRLLTVGITREFQVLAWIPGVANGECFAQVNVIGTHSLPQVSRMIPTGLGQDITHRVDLLITDILEEIKAERTN